MIFARNYLVASLCVFTVPLVTACAGSGPPINPVPKLESPRLPPLPAELQDCDNPKKKTARPKGSGDISEKQAGSTIAKLRKSEDRLFWCVVRLKGAYQDQEQLLNDGGAQPNSAK